jgi:hypothetical protein
MTTETKNSLNLHVGKGRGWKDLFVVTALVVVLGAFVAQIASSPKHRGQEQITSAPATLAVQG